MTSPAALHYLSNVIASATSRSAAPTVPKHAGAPDEIRDEILAGVEAVAREIAALSEHLHEHPELALQEHRASAAVAELLADHGLECEQGVGGLPTAFRAVAGDGRPRIAVVAEYDALPGLGHACGHNVICATAVGAFLAVREIVDRVGGSVVLLGTPGEEGQAGKELMARAGAFEELDAVVMLHPAGFDMARHTWLGARSATIEFTGRAAHASATPFLGRNALDGIVLAYQTLAMLRQHILPDDRIHMIITNGGETPGVIPARTAGQLAVRSGSPEGLRELSGRVEGAARAAAAATGTEVTVAWDQRPAYLPMRNNAPLSDRYALNAERTGRRLTEPGAVPANLSASTDLGNISVRVPAIQPLLRLAPPHVVPHSPEFTAYATGSDAAAAVREGAAALALTIVDYLADPELRRDVAAAFEAQGGPTTPSQLLGLSDGPAAR